MVNSEFSKSSWGELTLGVTYVFLNIFMTLSSGILLSILSVVQHMSYLKKRIARVSPQMKINPVCSSQNSSGSMRFTDGNKFKISNSMFFMTLTLCSISIGSRLLFTLCYVFYFLFDTFSTVIVIGSLSSVIFTLVPSTAIFIFYSFNQLFRQEIQSMFINAKLKLFYKCRTTWT